MNTSLNWIKALIPGLECTDREYSDAMTLSGTKVEGYERLDKNLEKIVVGEIKEIKPHPDADKLVVCQVDVGAETVQIVTGAPNVAVGQLVPVVLSGGKVAGGHDGGPMPEEGIEIKSGNLRGVDSYGMMCSIEELGSSRDVFPDAPENGIYIFSQDVHPGDDAIEALGLKDTVFEYEITSNRVDCYSVIGVAREAAATFRLPFKAPEIKETGTEETEKTSDHISIEIRDKDLCSRYVGRVVRDIRIGESPEWMKKRLRASGIRPINNLVDITNYVMLEYGQPMHAFDLSKIAGGKIIVRMAHDGEKFQTLDGQERELDSEVLMICDGEKEIAIAGIMGGENSKITDDIKDVLFESATFNGPNVRKSAKRIGLRTDSSGIFEKGLDPNNALEAMNRACELVEELKCGRVLNGAVDVHDALPEKKRIPFEPERINEYLGTAVSEEEMLEYFGRLEIEYDEKAKEVIVPTFRQDLAGFADIAEEVARFYGYDKIPVTLPGSSATPGKLSFKLRVESVARETAEFLGFSQGMSYSFESPKVFDKLLLPGDAPERKAIRISNPLGEDFSVMRTISLNGILSSLSTNYNRRNKNVHLYELGNIYLPKALPLTELPEERMQMTFGFYGEGDFYSMKGVLEEILKHIGLKGRPTYENTGKRPYLHPGRQADISYDGTVIGYLGELHPETAIAYEMKDERIYVAVLDMPELVSRADFDIKYEGIAKYPSVTRDLSMVVPKTVMAGQIDAVIVQRSGKLLESFHIFDVYEGDQIEEGYKSIAYSVTFRNNEKTMSDEEVSSVMKKILNGLEGLGIRLRS
ncbi:MAG: phenylalanine--tRNA ligase subunit beta [Lachnospiraceae bacterium]|nr:phenylalanine--tRNA ligase subunit beta [Lachnospiraceae bacterium]